MNCIICGRKLTNPASVRRGIGPVCAGKRRGEGPMLYDNEKHHRVRGKFEDDIIMSRDPDGSPVVNIEQALKLHSPNGFEWGYGGSGPADFALNILLRYTTKEIAYELHQDFKWKFVGALPREGGIIRGSVIRDWLKMKMLALPAEKCV